MTLVLFGVTKMQLKQKMENKKERLKRIKLEAIRNVITSEFEIKEGLKISFDEGYKEGIKKAKKEIKNFIKKIDSNWYYCENKIKYGNDIIYFIREIVEDFKKIEKYLNTKNLIGGIENGRTSY